MNNTSKVILTLSMLLSINGIKARYLNYSRIVQVVAKLKSLGKNTAKIEAFEKNFKNSYVNSWFLLPREYNKLSALILELLDTAERKSANQQDTMFQVLGMIDEELRGLINRHGYHKEFIELSYCTSELRMNLTKGYSINPLHTAALKRTAQDLLVRVLLTETTAEPITARVIKSEEKKSQNESDPYEGTDPKS